MCQAKNQLGSINKTGGFCKLSFKENQTKPEHQTSQLGPSWCTVRQLCNKHEQQNVLFANPVYK